MTYQNQHSITRGERTGTRPDFARGAHSIDQLLQKRREDLTRCLAELDSGAIAILSAEMVATLRSGRKLLVAGNGGSAAEAQHFAAELVGRFQRERSPYAALALSTDTSILTAVANDYGYDSVFSRQVQALGSAGDMLIVLSTSGTSSNLIQAALAAHERVMYVAALTGFEHNPLTDLSDCSIRVPLAGAASIQEVQGILLHLLCEVVETELALAEEAGSCD